jgi:hypothetical protein
MRFFNVVNKSDEIFAGVRDLKRHRLRTGILSAVHRI